MMVLSAQDLILFATVCKHCGKDDVASAGLPLQPSEIPETTAQVRVEMQCRRPECRGRRSAVTTWGAIGEANRRLCGG
jgi:hypothetical protein